jgi:hypothetical protein
MQITVFQFETSSIAFHPTENRQNCGQKLKAGMAKSFVRSLVQRYFCPINSSIQLQFSAGC